jgi:hypothetical protein
VWILVLSKQCETGSVAPTTSPVHEHTNTPRYTYFETLNLWIMEPQAKLRCFDSYQESEQLYYQESEQL